MQFFINIVKKHTELREFITEDSFVTLYLYINLLHLFAQWLYVNRPFCVSERFLHKHACIYVCMYVCMYIYVCMYVCMFICMTETMNANLYIHTYIHIYIQTNIRNSFVQLTSNFCVKIAKHIMNWVAICSN